MPPKQQGKKVLVKSEKLTQGEKKKLKNDNKAKANPEKAAAKKEKNDASDFDPRAVVVQVVQDDIRSHVVIQTKELDLRNLRVRATTMRVHQHKITSLGYFWLLPLPPHAFCSSLEGSRQEYERRILNEERESYVTHG